jgi:vancomycin permeability regulator SanA
MKRFRSFIRLLKIALAAVIAAALLLALALAVDGLTDELQPVDVAVVPGNRVNPDGTPSPWLKARLDRTLQLYQQGLFPNIIVSGGTGVEGFDEALVMKDYLVAGGVSPAVIIVDSHGDNTYATALNSAALMHAFSWKSALVISQFYQIPRTKLALSRFGIAQVYGAHAEGLTWRGLISLARELVAYPVYFVRDY